MPFHEVADTNRSWDDGVAKLENKGVRRVTTNLELTGSTRLAGTCELRHYLTDLRSSNRGKLRGRTEAVSLSKSPAQTKRSYNYFVSPAARLAHRSFIMPPAASMPATVPPSTSMSVPVM
jgi:hypothetical protein